MKTLPQRTSSYSWGVQDWDHFLLTVSVVLERVEVQTRERGTFPHIVIKESVEESRITILQAIEVDVLLQAVVF